MTGRRIDRKTLPTLPQDSLAMSIARANRQCPKMWATRSASRLSTRGASGPHFQTRTLRANLVALLVAAYGWSLVAAQDKPARANFTVGDGKREILPHARG